MMSSQPRIVKVFLDGTYVGFLFFNPNDSLWGGWEEPSPYVNSDFAWVEGAAGWSTLEQAQTAFQEKIGEELTFREVDFSPAT